MVDYKFPFEASQLDESISIFADLKEKAAKRITDKVLCRC